MRVEMDGVDDLERGRQHVRSINATPSPTDSIGIGIATLALLVEIRDLLEAKENDDGSHSR